MSLLTACLVEILNFLEGFSKSFLNLIHPPTPILGCLNSWISHATLELTLDKEDSEHPPTTVGPFWGHTHPMPHIYVNRSFVHPTSPNVSIRKSSKSSSISSTSQSLTMLASSSEFSWTIVVSRISDSL